MKQQFASFLLLMPLLSSAVVRAQTCADLVDPALPKSQWVGIKRNGKLSYANYQTADIPSSRILNFSHAGYKGGGVALPSVPTFVRIEPSGNDDTAAIQIALNRAALLPLKNGFRGAVELSPGTFQLHGTLKISASGVVLRGSGSSSTILSMRGEPRTALEVIGSGNWREEGNATTLVDEYIPAGSYKLHVASTEGFAIGDSVLIGREATESWIRFMQMDQLVRGGKPQTWIGAGTVMKADREIVDIQGKYLVLDAPITDAFDSRFSKTPASLRVRKYQQPGRIENVGIENLRVVVANPIDVTIGVPAYKVLAMEAVKDGWVRDVAAIDFNSGFGVSGNQTKRITIDRSLFERRAPTEAIAKGGIPPSFSIGGQQVLILRSATIAEKTPIFTHRNSQLNVVFDYYSESPRLARPSGIAPHQRWGTGLLVDNAAVINGYIAYQNRMIMGSGHGWTMGNGVVWNSQASELAIESPPGAANFVVGTSGRLVHKNSAVFDLPAKRTRIKSLYLAQLCERLGPEAVKNIGYDIKAFMMPEYRSVLGRFELSERPAGTLVRQKDDGTFSPAEELSISTWFKLEKDPSNADMQVIVSKRQRLPAPSRDFAGYSLDIVNAPSPLLRLFLNIGGEPVLMKVPAEHLLDKQFHHVAATYDGANVRLWIDNKLAASQAATGKIQYAEHNLCLAGDGGGKSCSKRRFFVGTIRDVTLWDRALSSEDVGMIFRLK